jgi:arylsulfatase A-like enzyme
LPPSYGAEMAGCPVFASRQATADANKRNWGEAGFRRLTAAYYGNIAMIDHYIGTIISRMEELGLWEDTTVIFTADHGDHMGNYGLTGKGDMYDPSAKIPLLIKPAHSDVSNERIPEVVNSIDLFGTISELAGFEGWREYGDEARSLVPFLQGDSANWENKTFSIIGADLDRNSLCMLRRDQYKLIRYKRPDEQVVYELFDLDRDDFEQVNLYRSETHRAMAASMTDELEEWTRFQKQRKGLTDDHQTQRPLHPVRSAQCQSVGAQGASRRQDAESRPPRGRGRPL